MQKHMHPWLWMFIRCVWLSFVLRFCFFFLRCCSFSHFMFLVQIALLSPKSNAEKKIKLRTFMCSRMSKRAQPPSFPLKCTIPYQTRQTTNGRQRKQKESTKRFSDARGHKPTGNGTGTEGGPGGVRGVMCAHRTLHDSRKIAAQIAARQTRCECVPVHHRWCLAIAERSIM